MPDRTIPVITPAAIRQILVSGEEVAFLDIREAGEYGNGHALLAVNLAWSELEVRAEQVIPRRSTLIILQDEVGDDRALTAALRLQQLGYQQLRLAEGGVQGWQRAGFSLFKGVNVPSKAFSEWIEREAHTPTLSAETLAEWQQQDKPHLLLDGRTPEEFRQFHIPGAVNCPNGELISWVRQHRPSLPIVVTCAGRTRGIIGAQSLIDDGIQQPVLALAGGTQAWRIAHLPLIFDDHHVWSSSESAEITLTRLDHPAVDLIDSKTLLDWQQDNSRTTYLFDVRSREEYLQGSVAGAVWVPAGQLIQTLDEHAAVRGARIVVFDPLHSRARVAAWWLHQLGWHVSCYTGEASFIPSATPALDPAALFPDVKTYTAEAARAEYQPDDLILLADRSKNLQQPVLQGGRWINRARLAHIATTLPQEKTVWVFAGQSSLALGIAWDLIVQYGFDARVVSGSGEEWVAAGWPVAEQPLFSAEDRLDYLFWLHDRHGGNLQASADYLAWEAGLPAAVDKEGLHGFRRLQSVTEGEKQ